MAVPPGENQYIYGLHDRGGEHLLIDNDQAKGWVLVTEEIRANPNDTGGGNYQDLTDRGLGVIVRLNHAYGNQGTVPHSSQYDNFARRCANFARTSKGAHIWIIGNEMNLEREQPRGQAITPRLYAECYKKCRAAIKGVPGHANDQVVVGAIGPWNGETPYEADPQRKYPANKLPNGPNHHPYNGFWGDFIKYMQDMLLAIGVENCDAIAIHAYSHGYKPDMVFNEQKMNAPFQDYYFNFYTYRDQMNAIPPAFRKLPVYCTEANGDREPDIPTDPNNKNNNTWPFGNNGWVQNAYREINNWNRQAGNQQIRCMILFRWLRDKEGWSIDGKRGVQQDLQAAVRHNYQWNPDQVVDTSITRREGALPKIDVINVSTTLPINRNQPPYEQRATGDIRRFIIHHTATPSSVTVERIAQFQVTNRNLPGISYHYCLSADGDIFQTQSLETISRHAGQYSNDSIGICLIGNFTNAAPPEAQLKEVSALIANLADQLEIIPDENTIVGYRDLINTQSPGATWPTWKPTLVQNVREALSGSAPTELPEPEQPGPEPEGPEVPPYRAEYLSHNSPTRLPAKQTQTVRLQLKNTGSFTWVHGGGNPFRLGFRWFDRNNRLIELPSELDFRTPLPKEVAPGEMVTLQAQLRSPDSAGRYRLRWEMVHENITWFSDQGDPGLTVENVTVTAAPVTQPEPGDRPPVSQPGGSLQIKDLTTSLPTNTEATPYRTRNRRLIRRLVIHHSATSAAVTPERIAQFQTQRQSKAGITYHFCVNAQGKVFQTQPLETVSTHAAQFSTTSAGVCLIGNFMEAPPPAAQLKGAAALLGYLGQELSITLGETTVRGFSELINTQSPGATWASWKPSLLMQAQTAPPATTTPGESPPTEPAAKVIEHYLLFWHKGANNWAEWDVVSALDYIAQFAPTVGFSVDEAKQAKYVTIVGGPAGVPASAEVALRAAGCRVERLNGRTQEETNQMLYDLIAENKRFRDLE